jgi:type II secretion system protein G
MKINRKFKGFTLIELLIVVAIIAILAAIAIPNFLAAQVRSKVSRVKADVRSIATALECYRTDNTAYPSTWLDLGGGLEPLPWEQRLVPLSTPISYISSVPVDAFRAQGHVAYNYDDAASYPVGNVLPSYSWLNNWAPNPYAWQLVSIGPALFLNWASIYDPTNGTVSNGCIYRGGP